MLAGTSNFMNKLLQKVTFCSKIGQYYTFSTSLGLKTNSTRHFCHDLELHGGDLISSPVDSIVSLVLPKKSYGPNSVGKNYFSATPFSLLAKNATGGHNA